MYLYTCERCAPEGLCVEEYATRPLAEVCFVCGAEARRWYTSADQVLKALLRERMRERDQTNQRDAREVYRAECPPELLKASEGFFTPLREREPSWEDPVAALRELAPNEAVPAGLRAAVVTDS